MSLIENFLCAVDAQWHQQHLKINLDIIGAAALRLQAPLTRGTKDSDVLETTQLTGEVRDALLALAGQGSTLHAKHRMYIEIVSQGLPFLPQAPSWHELPALNARLHKFHVRVLDVVDVVLSKLKRFSANDRSDIDEMIEANLVPHAQLKERFALAFDWFQYGARATDLPHYVENLNAVERDSFGVTESIFDLPDWTNR